MRLKASYFLGIAGLLACTIGSAGDTLKIENIADSDKIVVLIDSRTSANGLWRCRDDEVLRVPPSAADPTTVELDLGDVPAGTGCNSEIVVFAEGNAMALSFPGWSDSVNDTRTITMKPIINVPVSVWIANQDAWDLAPSEIDNATQIYRKNKVGVQFVATYQNVSSDARAVATIGKSCDSIGWIRRSAWYTPNTLNIYYVKRITLPPELGGGGASGLTCDRFGDGDIKGDANIIFIGPSPDPATVAHEIGHAFGLRPGNAGGHTGALEGMPRNNVMCTSNCVAPRDHFSLGQAFRMNTQADEWGGTMLIANGLRPGPGRACPPLTTSNICPPLTLDWSRP